MGNRALFYSIFSILLCAGAAGASGSTYLFQGAFTTDNQIELVAITVNATEQVTVRAYGYGGGTVDGATVPAGGFAPNAILFDGAGNEIASDPGGHCTVTAADPTTGNCDDAYIQETLAPGSYTLALAEYDNEPAGSLFNEGFNESANPGFTCAELNASGSFCDVTTALGTGRTGNYALAVTADQAMDITNVDGAIAYLVGDVAPYTSDTAPNFGDGVLNILDLIQELFGVNNIPGYQPAACSDRFDAMDTYPADAVGVRGGDGALDIQDLIVELFRANNLDTTRPVRVTRNGTCAFGSSSSAESLTDASRPAASPARLPGPAQGELALGNPRESGTAEEQVPVYLEAKQNLFHIAVTFALGDGRSALRFVPAPGAPPSLVEDSRPGVVAAAWLSGLSIPAGQQVLLGYVAGPPGISANLIMYGASASGLDDKRKVELRLP